MSNYLFSKGIARGDTGLVAHLLSVTSKVKIVSDPFLAFYKSFCNSVVKNNKKFNQYFDLSSPFGDSYFAANRKKLLDLIIELNINIAFDQPKWNTLTVPLKKRAQLASAYITPYIDNLNSNSYKKVFILRVFEKIKGFQQ